MTPTTSITLYYDYLCPYAFRATQLLTEIEQTRPDVSVSWRFFSVEQVNAPSNGRDENWHIWEQPLDYEPIWRSRRRRSLAAFLVTQAAQAQNPARLPGFRLAVFDALHHQHADISNPEVLLELAGQSGLNVEALRAAWHTEANRLRLRDDIECGRQAGAFGVPTFIINNSDATYIRLAEYPDDAVKRQALFDELVYTVTQRPCLLELKRASAA